LNSIIICSPLKPSPAIMRQADRSTKFATEPTSVHCTVFSWLSGQNRSGETGQYQGPFV
jgi:hypothetical protein